MKELDQLLEPYPFLKKLTEAQLAIWPEHKRYLQKSFIGHSVKVFNVLEKISSLILKLANLNGIQSMCSDYRFLCEEIVLKEELYFRRHGTYRLSTFEEANREVYSNAGLMERYMNGLLLSGIFWTNHANAYAHYIYSFLPGNCNNYKHLEIGCGHGLLVYFAANDPNCQSVTGWDISMASLVLTKRCLEIIGVGREVYLKQQNIFDVSQSGEKFDSIVISEILEHLENPESALKALSHILKPRGRIWVNVPLNSPAPDHLYLLKEPEEVTKMINSAGLDIEDFQLFPLNGYTEEEARRKSYTITISAIAKRPIS